MGTRHPSTACERCTQCFASPDSTCSWQSHATLPLQKLQLELLQELLVVQNIQVSYVLTCEWTIIPCTTDLQPLSSSGAGATSHNSVQNQSICTANLKGWGYVNIILEGIINYIKIHAKFKIPQLASEEVQPLDFYPSEPLSFLIVYVLGAVLRIKMIRISKQRKMFNTGSIGQSYGFFFSETAF